MKISILGAGTFGVALGRMLANNNHEVYMWSFTKEGIDDLLRNHTCKNLGDADVPESIKFSTDIKDVCEYGELILIAVPSFAVRSTLTNAKQFIKDGMILVNVAKGFESSTLFTMSEVIEDVLNDGCHKNCKVVVLSGPTHAEEVAKDIPTTIVSASKDLEASKLVQDVFMNTCMRVYTNDDVLGIEICGALKNIIALSSGISTGLGFGDNTKAAIITRGMAEIKRLGLAMGCHNDTFSGLAGIGDLIVTATSNHSRNNRCGMLIGQGVKAKDATVQIGQVVEGLNALPAAIALKDKYNVEMPIIQMVDDVVNERISPRDSVIALMSRDKKHECK